MNDYLKIFHELDDMSFESAEMHLEHLRVQAAISYEDWIALRLKLFKQRGYPEKIPSLITEAFETNPHNLYWHSELTEALIVIGTFEEAIDSAARYFGLALAQANRAALIDAACHFLVTHRIYDRKLEEPSSYIRTFVPKGYIARIAKCWWQFDSENFFQVDGPGYCSR